MTIHIICWKDYCSGRSSNSRHVTKQLNRKSETKICWNKKQVSQNCGKSSSIIIIMMMIIIIIILQNLTYDHAAPVASKQF